MKLDAVDLKDDWYTTWEICKKQVTSWSDFKASFDVDEEVGMKTESYWEFISIDPTPWGGVWVEWTEDTE